LAGNSLTITNGLVTAMGGYNRPDWAPRITLGSAAPIIVSNNYNGWDDNNGIIAFKGGIHNNGYTLTISNTPAVTFPWDSTAGIAGAGGLTKRGSGSLILEYNNSYTGQTVILDTSNGRVSVQAANAFGTTNNNTSVACQFLRIYGTGTLPESFVWQCGYIDVQNHAGPCPGPLTGYINLQTNLACYVWGVEYPLQFRGPITETGGPRGVSLYGGTSSSRPGMTLCQFWGTNNYSGTTCVNGAMLEANGWTAGQGSYVVTCYGTNQANSWQTGLSGTGTLGLAGGSFISLTGSNAALRAVLSPGTSTIPENTSRFCPTSSIGRLTINGGNVALGNNSEMFVQMDGSRTGGTANANDLLVITGGHLDLTTGFQTLSITNRATNVLNGTYIFATFDDAAGYGSFENVTYNGGPLPGNYMIHYNAGALRFGPPEGTTISIK
jgi:autotransporter-associated beta strand protein